VKKDFPLLILSGIFMDILFEIEWNYQEI